ncbi:MAG: hypothetical protein JNN32_13900 [Flavobacteriales bacterium]|nr:hypothetical protein [Flavobacteriales bacterium]
MRPIAYIAVLFLATACGDAQQRAAERALYTGEHPYREGRFDAAARIYAEADHDARVAYNLGNALLQQQLTDSSIQAYIKGFSEEQGDSVNAMTYHNLGNAWATLALKADTAAKKGRERMKNMPVDGTDLVTKVRNIVMLDSITQENMKLDQVVDSALAQSADAYKNGLRRRPSDEDTRYNLALVQQHIAARVKEAKEREKNKEKDKDQQELSERAKRLMQQADSLVDRYQFTKALEILQAGVKADPSLQQKQDYMNKLDVVTKAAKAK